MTKSQYICGRAANTQAFKKARENNGCFVVTSFTTYHGDRMYADACYVGPREDYDASKIKRRQGKQRYRVIVTPRRIDQ